MKEWVDFATETMTEFRLRGYVGVSQALPIDNLAALVLSSDVNPIMAISVKFHPSGDTITYYPMETSRTHIGAVNHTVRIDGMPE